MSAPAPVGASRLALTLASVALASACGACLPNFDYFQMATNDGGTRDSATGDSATDGDTDGGAPIDWSTVNRGVPCESPHLTVAMRGRSTGVGAALFRYNLPEAGATVAECRETPAFRAQAAFGNQIYSVAGLPDGTEVVGLSNGVLALDGDGFPKWRYQPWSGSISAFELFPLTLGGNDHIGVLYCNGSCSSGYEAFLVLDAAGGVVTEVAEVRYNVETAASSPVSGFELLVGRDYGPLQLFPMTEDTVEIVWSHEVDNLLAGGFEHRDEGALQSLEVDLTTHRLLVAYQDSVARWTVGDAAPELVTCAACSTYERAAIDPRDLQSFFAICDGSGSTHLVHVGADSCEIVVDGSLYSDHIIADVALVRGAI